MAKKNLPEYKRKYDISRHHAWAGLGFLAILAALRVVIPDLAPILQPILFLLIIYILISLILTYRYRAGLTAPIVQPDHKDSADLKKQQVKLEKKKAKTQVKIEKKRKK